MLEYPKCFTEDELVRIRRMVNKLFEVARVAPPAAFILHPDDKARLAVSTLHGDSLLQRGTFMGTTIDTDIRVPLGMIYARY